MYIFVFQIINKYKMGYKINLDTKITIEIDNYNFKNITFAFLSSLCNLFEDFVSKILLYYFEKYYESGRLATILGVKSVKKKTTKKTTQFKTIFGTIKVPQIQVRVIDFNGFEHQMSITRTLLGVSEKFQIPDFMKEIIGWIGAVSSFRVGHNIIGVLTNLKCSLMSVWQSVQWSASNIKLELHKDGTNELSGDGTGVPTKEGGKRGSELKVVFQKKKNGKLHLVGLAIGMYKETKNWYSALSPSLEAAIAKFKKVILASDGDKTIINVAKSISEKIFIQMDKWHVFHQLKYYLWQDGADKDMKYSIIAHCFKITMLSKLSIKKRDKRIKRYIFLLYNIGYKHTATYLQSAMKYFYTHETQGNSNIYTSKTERAMRTINQRINVGKWSRAGALNAVKIRLVYYYNGINPFKWKKEA